MTECAPLAAAVAALLVAVTPSVAALLVALANRAQLGRVEGATNGHLASLREEVTELRAALLEAARRAPAEGERWGSGHP